MEEGEDDERGHLSAVCGGRGGFIGPNPDAGDLQPIRAGLAGSRRLLRNPFRSLSTTSMYELKPIKGCYVGREISFAREKLTLVSYSRYAEVYDHLKNKERRDSPRIAFTPYTTPGSGPHCVPKQDQTILYPGPAWQIVTPCRIFFADE